MRADPELRFEYRLALALGMTHAELVRSVSAREIRMWWALWQLEPWGETAAAASRALVGSAVCGSMGGKVKPSELLPQWEQQSAKTSARAAWYAKAREHYLKTTGASGRK